MQLSIGEIAIPQQVARKPIRACSLLASPDQADLIAIDGIARHWHNRSYDLATSARLALGRGGR